MMVWLRDWLKWLTDLYKLSRFILDNGWNSGLFVHCFMVLISYFIDLSYILLSEFRFEVIKNQSINYCTVSINQLSFKVISSPTFCYINRYATCHGDHFSTKFKDHIAMHIRASRRPKLAAAIRYFVFSAEQWPVESFCLFGNSTDPLGPVTWQVLSARREPA